MTPLLVFLGAGIGGLARFAVGRWIEVSPGVSIPWPTLLVNVTGSFLLTLFLGIAHAKSLSGEWQAFVAIGICGGYTTFSAFSFETVRLMQQGDWRRATLYMTMSVVLSIAAAIAGFRTASVLFSVSV